MPAVIFDIVMRFPIKYIVFYFIFTLMWFKLD